MSELIYEQATEEHLEELKDIYNYYVLHTTVTYHMKALTTDEMRELVFFNHPRYRTFVIREEGNIVGYVLLTRFKPREAYDGTAEVTVYLKQDVVGKGIGSQAIQFIEGFAREGGIHVLLAIISGDNTKSINLFAKNGYFKCAHYQEVGSKFGQLLDVVVYQKILQ